MINKLMLFISSYIPLYILLIIKNILERITEGGRFVDIKDKLKNAVFFDEINDWAICVLLLMISISYIYLKIILKNSGGNKKYTVIEIVDETGNIYFTYISIYFLSCIGFSLNSVVDSFILVFVMIIIGYIYISHNMMYMNPVMNMMGYRVFYCNLYSNNTSDKDIHSLVVVPKNIQIMKNEGIIGSGEMGFIIVDKGLRDK